MTGVVIAPLVREDKEVALRIEAFLLTSRQTRKAVDRTLIKQMSGLDT